MKYCKIYTALCIVLLIMSCNNDDECKNECLVNISYTVDVTQFTTFLPDDQNLTIEESALVILSNEKIEVTFCRSTDSTYNGVIKNILNTSQEAEFVANTIGKPRNFIWECTFDEKKINIPEAGLRGSTRVEEISAEVLDNLINFNQSELVSSSDFSKMIQDLKNDFTVEVQADGNFLLSATDVDGSTFETIISKSLQREISQTVFNAQGEMESLHTWFYNKNGASISLQSEMIQLFTPSPDSDKTIVVNRFLKFKNVTVK